ncbi:aromatic acid exporter family protein [Mangrovibacillus cuniculi]|uniref:Aromatic acid exporter family protein n=1 Tax=Mangrovibacillus cuniculi TaxID=2593652 RepID=A0A7S8CBH8_9BACI|nr:aromatic acid exporter family protein [Mangrovibacillus cuniculi]QPC46796.1 aromatic acid exporter family protein [Mangrovibacillus cuniculi]
MFKIGYRTIKTAIGTAVAIMIAQWFQLDNFASAGIITILCIQATKKKSIIASWSRFLACMVSMLYSAAFFEWIAYHPIIIGLMLVVFIPTVVSLRASEGIVTSSVIILHIYSAGQVTWGLIINEIGLIVIGIGIALLMNLYMPSVENKLHRYQEAIEASFQRIFEEMVTYLRSGESNWDGKEIVRAEKLLREAKSLAFIDVENHFLRHENLYYHYFKMREKQFEIIERILPLITSLPSTTAQCGIIADFLDDLSTHIHPGNTAFLYLKKLYDIQEEFKEMDLPSTREEFEVRAALFQLVREMEQYLQIKSSFKGIKTNENSVNHAH